MVLINGTEFDIYELDTPKSIVKRLASSLKTLPRYLYFPDGLPTKDDGKNIRVEDILSYIKKDEDFNVIFASIKDKLDHMKSDDGLYKNGLAPNLNLERDILTPYIVYNRDIAETDSAYIGTILLQLRKSIDNNSDIVFDTKPDVSSIWNERKVILKAINDSINENDIKVRYVLDTFRDFESLKADANYTEFEPSYVDFEFSIDIPNMQNTSIMEIFNSIQLSEGVPFASIRGFFKILKDFIPAEDWSMNVDDAIIFKVAQNISTSSVDLETDYTDAFLTILEGEDGKRVINIGMTLQSQRHYLTSDTLIERLLDTIDKGTDSKSNIKISNIIENRLNGVFYIPQTAFNIYVFSDMVMNNPILSSMMAIDESEKASKQKKSIYIHFNNETIGVISANITEKVSLKGDPNLRGKDVRDLFKVGTNYIRVKISYAENLKSVILFQKLFLKVISLYNKEYESIVAFYRKFIPTFADTKVFIPPPIKKLTLKDIAPEVFIDGYPPTCPQQPSIIEDNEVEEAKKEGMIVMRYPQTAAEGIPRNYICEHKAHIYPGLRENDLPNKESVPYLPCCYKKDPNTRKGSYFRHYYHGEDVKRNVNADQQDLIVTNKFVTTDKFGTLPPDITKMFDIFNYDSEFKYIRKGVRDTKSSFLDCVMEGMHDTNNILDYNDTTSRTKLLNKIRIKLSARDTVASARQEMYDFTIKEISEIVRDPNIYLDPKFFISMLEEYFDCNIYVFNRKYNKNGELSSPRYIQSYYKFKKKKRSIFIYEHSGSRSDASTYPRCELIVRWKVKGNADDDTFYYSNYSSKISSGIRKVFNNMHTSYALNTRVKSVIFPLNSDIKLLGQGIDSYGKCRMVKVKVYVGSREYTSTILTSPIQPLVLQEVIDWKVKKLDLSTAIDIASIMEIAITGQGIVQNVVKELYGILGNVNITLPVNDTDPIDGIKIVNKGISYSDNTESSLDNYNRYKKLARYITEYVYWLYSHYIHENSLENNISDHDVITTFAASLFKIDPDFNYGQVNKSFSMTSGVMDGGKLVIKSEETLKRLLYVLRIAINNSKYKIIDYYNNKVIVDYYSDVTDFDMMHNQVVLQGDNSVDNWINEKKMNYDLYNSIQPESRVPYFFKNPLVGNGEIFLAQNAFTLLQARNIAEIWHNDRYNPGENVDENVEELMTIKLYSYASPSDIIAYTVKGEPTDNEAKILGYKIGVDSRFTTLLSF